MSGDSIGLTMLLLTIIFVGAVIMSGKIFHATMRMATGNVTNKDPTSFLRTFLRYKVVTAVGRGVANKFKGGKGDGTAPAAPPPPGSDFDNNDRKPPADGNNGDDNNNNNNDNNDGNGGASDGHRGQEMQPPGRITEKPPQGVSEGQGIPPARGRHPGETGPPPTTASLHDHDDKDESSKASTYGPTSMPPPRTESEAGSTATDMPAPRGTGTESGPPQAVDDTATTPSKDLTSGPPPAARDRYNEGSSPRSGLGMPPSQGSIDKQSITDRGNHRESDLAPPPSNEGSKPPRSRASGDTSSRHRPDLPAPHSNKDNRPPGVAGDGGGGSTLPPSRTAKNQSASGFPPSRSGDSHSIDAATKPDTTIPLGRTKHDVKPTPESDKGPPGKTPRSTWEPINETKQPKPKPPFKDNHGQP